MADDDTAQCLLFEGLAKRPVTVRFDQERGSSDGGAVLLGAADRWLGLSDALARLGEDELASQPTLSRFENGAGRADLFRMGEALAERVIERLSVRQPRTPPGAALSA